MADLRFSKILEKLSSLRSRFGSQYAVEKTALVEELSLLNPVAKKDILKYHELLLFFRAYPDEPAFLKTVNRELHKLTALLKQLSEAQPEKFYRNFHGTGLAHGSIDWQPSLEACKWLINNFGDDVTLTWDADFAERIGPFLSFFCSKAEQDGLTDDRFDTRDWLMLASGTAENEQKEQLQYILKRFDALQGETALKDHLFELLSPEVRLKLNHPVASRTTNLFTPEKIFFQRESLLRDFEPLKIINKPVFYKKLSGEKATKLISIARGVLAARSRETDPFSFAGDVWEADLERGLCIYLYSMVPGRRMPLENYTGFLAFRNGVPIGYGGGWIFIERCEIGVNIFDTFRGGENSYIFTNIMRVYQQVFGIKQFAVPPYQFGAGNEEGLKSGAFWFYYKLGFRPANQTLAMLAASESLKIEQTKSYHSPARILKKLADYPLELNTGPSMYQMEPRQISIIITKWIAAYHRSDHRAATTRCITKLKALPGIKLLKDSNEKTALENLAIFLALPEVITSLSKTEQNSMVELIRLKGGDEIQYSQLLKKQRQLLDAWQDMVNKEIINS